MTADPIAAAVGIGEELCEGAYWDGARCAWMGANSEFVALGAAARIVHRPLGPDLYGGTAGVGAFLAELAAVTGSASTRRTALGALAHAAGAVDRIGSYGRAGLYTGLTGIAVALARAAHTLEAEDLLVEARELVDAILAAAAVEEEFDLIAGTAGTVLGLLALHDLGCGDRLVEHAALLGERLLASADKGPSGLSWAAAHPTQSANLCGFAHGAAGAALALLELFATTGGGRYRNGAEAAFDYERSWFDAEQRNWPDLRGHDSRRGMDPSTSFPTFWCHGAPGIALTRLRAAALLEDPRYAIEATAALDTTRSFLEAELRFGPSDFSLCHGVAGNADVLLLGHAAMNDPTKALDIAARIASVGSARYLLTGAEWPCGLPSGETPGLLLGTSGIGLFYLRQHDPSVPSPLVARPLAAGQTTGVSHR